MVADERAMLVDAEHASDMRRTVRIPSLWWGRRDVETASINTLATVKGSEWYSADIIDILLYSLADHYGWTYQNGITNLCSGVLVMHTQFFLNLKCRDGPRVAANLKVVTPPPPPASAWKCQCEGPYPIPVLTLRTNRSLWK